MFWSEVHRIDQLLTLEINSWSSFITDPIWQFFSAKLVWAPIYAAIIGLLIWKLGWKRGLIVLGAAIFTFGFCDQFANVVKHAVGRIRPLHDAFMTGSGLNILETGGGLSFFSAHAANAFGLATCTFVAMKRILMPKAQDTGKTSASSCSRMPLWLKAYGVWMFFWAPMVAVSRVFVGKHYLGDILVGSLVGVLAGYLMAVAASKICKRL